MKEEYIKSGELIYNLRTKHKMTQYELAKQIGTDYRNISKWELGTTFPDKAKQERLCEIFNITLEELHKGKLNHLKRKRENIIKICFTIFAIVVPILLVSSIAFLITLINYKENYNPSTIYYLSIKDVDRISFTIEGLYIQNKKENTIYIGNIKPLDYEIQNTDNIVVNFYYNDKIVYTKDSLSNILFSVDSSINVNDIKIKIIITNSKGKTKFEKELVLYLSELSDKSLNDSISDIDAEEYINKLIKIGYKKINDDEYKYEENTKNKNIKILYPKNNSKFYYKEKNNNLSIEIEYNLTANYLVVNIISNIDNDTTAIENYEYYLDNKKLVNKIGKGYTLKNILKIQEKYMPRLISDNNSLK